MVWVELIFVVVKLTDAPDKLGLDTTEKETLPLSSFAMIVPDMSVSISPDPDMSPDIVVGESFTVIEIACVA